MHASGKMHWQNASGKMHPAKCISLNCAIFFAAAFSKQSPLIAEFGQSNSLPAACPERGIYCRRITSANGHVLD